jgi:alpha/beta superfamily hydrolase
MISVFCFDFAGCGLSDGEYISLGWYERDDVEVVVNYLRESNRVSTIGLWGNLKSIKGRSMGAVTALMHADRDPSIAALVLDSPFTSLKTLAEELAKTYAKVMKRF